MDDSILVLTFEGSQTIEKAEAVKKTLLDALKGKKKEILINLSRVEKVDLSFLQLLYSAGLEAVSRKKKISINKDCPETFLDVIELTGFDRIISENPSDIFSQLYESGE